MPKAKKANTQEVQELETETPTDSGTDNNVTDRLAQIEAFMEKIASQPAQAPQPVQPPPTSPAVTRGRARTSKTIGLQAERRSVSHDPTTNRQQTVSSHSSNAGFTSNSSSASRQRVTDASLDVPASRCDVHRDPVTSQPGDPFLQVNNAAHAQQLIDVGPGNSWNTWSRSATNPLQPHSHQSINSFASGNMNFDRDDVEQRVHDILASTASTISRGNVHQGPYSYPYKYVLRGPERQRVTINSVSLSEHLWGLVRMIRDEKLNPAIRPHLNKHLVEVIEDSCDFHWENVRAWSEEVFSLIAEDRFPGGWAADQRIQMLRLSMSRIHAARQYSQKDTNNKDSTRRANQASYQSTDALRCGPCQAYNSPTGCQFQSGHLINGRKQQRVCTFCLFNSCAAYTHSEVHCRNKTKVPPPHHF